ncbi:LytTR family DNA-binding domain-containing protein [Clostridium sp.]|uniref:LytR/AlgR family response regulator transcription factor n=1 Tax=Clostridium sp. TaxID=1506 RepID=UPI002FCBCC95
MYNILILEDDCIQLKTLSDIIKQLDLIYHVYEARNIEEAIKIAAMERIDLFFIDINLRNESGLKFALEIRKIKSYRLTWIIFVTIYKDYMLSAFKKIHCYDYILKPYNKENIQNITKRLLSDCRDQVEVTETSENFIIVPIKNIQVKISVNEIIFVEVFIRTSIIHTIHGSFTIDYLSLKKLNSMIEDKYILQSHRSYLVNLKYINKIEKSNDKTSYKIYFNNTDKTALLGHSYKKCIMDNFNNVAVGK